VSTTPQLLAAESAESVILTITGELTATSLDPIPFEGEDEFWRLMGAQLRLQSLLVKLAEDQPRNFDYPTSRLYSDEDPEAAGDASGPLRVREYVVEYFQRIDAAAERLRTACRARCTSSLRANRAPRLVRIAERTGLAVAERELLAWLTLVSQEFAFPGVTS